MERDPLLTLAGLAVVALIACGAVWLLLRLGGAARGGPVVGYPPDRFPRQDLVRTGPLAELAAAQARLLAVHAELPARGAAAVWVEAFLGELRGLMDGAYRVAGIASIYGDRSALERVVAEVRAVERQVADAAMRHLLRDDAAFPDSQLDARLAVLRRFARELAGEAGAAL